MPKPKSKLLPHFSNLIKIISKSQENFSFTSGEWENNTRIVNSLVNILVEDTHPAIEEWRKKKEVYTTSEVSNILKVQKFLHHDIWMYYQGKLGDRLGYGEHIKNLTLKIKKLKKKPQFLNYDFCCKMFEYFDELHEEELGGLDLYKLERKLKNGEYEDFFATTLFFIAADMPGQERSTFPSATKQEIIKSSYNFFDNLIAELEEDKYYDYYHRKIIITPDINNQKMWNENTLSFKSPLLNRNNPAKDSIKFNFGFENKEKYEAFSITEMKINGEDFLYKHDPLPEEPEIVLDDRSCYKKHFIYSGIPESSSYEIVRTSKSLLGFPISESTYRLPFSTNDFKLEIKMSELNKESNMFFDISCSFFTPFSRTKRLSFTKSSSRHFEVHIKEFVPRGTGIKVTVKPSLSNLDLHTNSFRKDTVNLKADTIRITGVWENIKEEEYIDE